MEGKIYQDNYRIGVSHDIHPLVKHRPLILGGVEIPFELGLDGHSDADVLLHSVSEALIGALTLGDLGKIFPDSLTWTENLDSKAILSAIYGVCDYMGYEVNNVDISLILEKPKLQPYILSMRESVASLLHTNINNVSIKAGTNEHLGAFKDENAIACISVIMLRKK